MHVRTTVLAGVSALLLGGVVVPSGAAGAPAAPRLTDTPAGLERELRAQTAGHLVLGQSRAGARHFVGSTVDHPIARPSGMRPDVAPEKAARGFLSRYGSLLGLTSASHLAMVKVVPGAGRGDAVRFQQLSNGVPVLGAEVMVVLDAAKNVLSANGDTSRGTQPGTVAALDASAAGRVAVTATGKGHRTSTARLRAAAPALAVYDPQLLDRRGVRPHSLVWRTEVTDATHKIRDLVLVDATTGSIALRIDENAEAKSRFVCNDDNVVGAAEACTTAPFARVEGGPATGISDVDKAYDYSGATYDFYASKFGRDSLDGHGLPLRSTVKFCPDPANCPYQNAFWNGLQMVYGDSFASADDVVGHELTHGVTQYTSNLFYYFQAGAIDESMSDVFGELIDLTDGVGTDTAAVRWKLGEDLPASIGVVRDMLHPETFGDPDRLTSAMYKSTTSDNGGVHSNSGVNNKATALMVDGGTFNGQTITGLGTDKVARIYYEAQTRLITSATDYNDLFDILQQACRNLVGTHAIVANDCGSVTKAVTATEMNLQPTTGAAVPEAPVCDGPTVPRNLFFDNLENPASNNWQKAATVGFGWAYPQNQNAYVGYDPVYATSGRTEMWGDDPQGPNGPNTVDGSSDATITKATPVAVPSGVKTYLRFAHAFGFEDGFDGGNAQYTTNGGATWLDAGRLATHGGYNATSVAALNGPGWTGASGGYTSSRFDLSSLAGSSVRFRFHVASDASVGDQGWFIDDIRVYSCTPPSSYFTAVPTARVFSGTVGTIARSVQIAGLQGVPADASAVVVNVEVFRPTLAGYVRVTPAGTDASVAVQEFRAGETISNLVTVKLVNGAVQTKLSAGSGTVFMDVSGYYRTTGGSRFTGVPTARVFSGTVGTTPTVVTITGKGGVPTTATAVVLNTEVFNPTVAGYVRVTPAGSDPSVAVQEFAKGQAISNLVTVKLVNGALQVKLSAGSGTVFMDVAGYYSATGSAFTAVPTTRVFGGPVGTTPVLVPLAGRYGIPADATAVAINTEVFNPSAAGYVRVTPAGQDPAVAVQEFSRGQAISNLVVVKLVNGALQVKLSAGSATIFMDLAGSFQVPPV